MPSFAVDKKRAAVLMLQAALAFALAYAAISAFLHPFTWIGFLPVWMKTVAPAALSEFAILDLVAFLQLGLAAWILSGRHQKLAALAAGVFLLSVAAFNAGAFDIVFRDISLALAALALALLAE